MVGFPGNSPDRMDTFIAILEQQAQGDSSSTRFSSTPAPSYASMLQQQRQPQTARSTSPFNNNNPVSNNGAIGSSFRRDFTASVASNDSLSNNGLNGSSFRQGFTASSAANDPWSNNGPLGPSFRQGLSTAPDPINDTLSNNGPFGPCFQQGFPATPGHINDPLSNDGPFGLSFRQGFPIARDPISNQLSNSLRPDFSLAPVPMNHPLSNNAQLGPSFQQGLTTPSGPINEPLSNNGPFGPSFWQGFYVNCSLCQQKDQANAKCYECNVHLCAICVYNHERDNNTHFHTIFHFGSLADRVSPNGTRNSTQQCAPGNNEQNHNNNNSDGHSYSMSSDESNGSSSRVVGAGRRTISESSRNSSSSYDGSMTHMMNNMSLLTSCSSLYYQSDTPSPPIARNLLQIASPSVAPTQEEKSLSQKDPNNIISLPSGSVEMAPCERHQMEFHYFCNQCMVPICEACVQERHRNHRLMFISEGLQKASEMSSDLNCQLREVTVLLRQTLDGLHRMRETIEQRAQQVSIDIRCASGRVVEAIEAEREDNLHRVEQAKQVKLKHIFYQMHNVRTHYSNLARAMNILTNPAIYSNPVENMAANHQAFRQLIQARILGSSSFPVEDKLFSFVPATEVRVRYRGCLGKLQISDAPLTKSSLICRQPLLRMAPSIPEPVFPLPRAKARPIFGCKEIVSIQKTGRIPKLVWGKAGNTNGDICRPWGITINRQGQFIVSDRSNNRIQVFDCEGNYLFHFGTRGTGEGQFDRPSAVAVNPNDDLIVADKDNHRIQVFNRLGEFLFTFGQKGERIGEFLYPWDVACDNAGNIAVSDARNHRVQLFRWNGIFITKWGGEMNLPKAFDTPRGVTFDPYGNILLTDFNLHRIVFINRVTGLIRTMGVLGNEKGQFNRPQGIICDDKGWFIVADSRNYRFQVFNEDGKFQWMVGIEGKDEPEELDRPCDVALDPKGNIYIMDFGNDCIKVY